MCQKYIVEIQIYCCQKYLAINTIILLLELFIVIISLILTNSLSAKDVEDETETNASTASQVEVRAVFINCEKNIQEWQDDSENDFKRFDREELFKHSALTDCNKKLALTVKITTAPDHNVDDEYIPIDHVFEGFGTKRVRLLNPYVMRLRREKPLQAYKLRRIDTVSGVLSNKIKPNLNNPRSIITKKRVQRYANPTFEGEDGPELDSAAVFILDHDDSAKQSYSIRLRELPEKSEELLNNNNNNRKSKLRDCGLTLYSNISEAKKEIRTLSSAANKINNSQHTAQQQTLKRFRRDLTKRQGTNEHCSSTNTIKTAWARNKRNERNIKIEDTVVEEKFNSKRKEPSIAVYKETEIPFRTRSLNSKRPIISTSNYEGLSLLHAESIKHSKVNERNQQGVDHRLITSEDKQRHLLKGKTNENKSQKTQPVRVNYRNLDVGDDNDSRYTTEKQYAVYEIGVPNIWYGINVQLYEKLSTPEGKSVWNDITQGEVASVSSFRPEWSGEDVNVRYRPAEWISRAHFTLPQTNLCLLAPILTSPDVDISEDSQLDNSGSFAVVPIEDVLDLDDLDINHIKKRNKSYSEETTKPRLRRVVVHLSQAVLGGNPDSLSIVYNGPERYMTLPHDRPHHAQIDLEARADENQLVRVGSNGRISTVVSDGTRRTRCILTVQVSNTGLASAKFRAIVRDCGPEMSDLLKEEGIDETIAGPVLLAPKHTKQLKLVLPFELPMDIIRCNVALLNDGDEAVAAREVVVRKGDRCFCVWHCECVCLGEDPKLLCREMALSRQSAAGVSSQDQPRRARSVCYPDNLVVNITIVVVGVILSLLLLGIFKAIIGQMIKFIGVWGLDRMLKVPRNINHYYETSLKTIPVFYDDEGWPVHPFTKKRTVRLVSRPMEFILNSLMFLTLPSLIIWDCIKYFTGHNNKNYHGLDDLSSDTKQCYSSQDGQGVDNRLRRRPKTLRRWMTQQAEDLSADIWQRSLMPMGINGEIMRPLLRDNDHHFKLASGDDLPSSCPDSDHEDAKYVYTQVQKSRESIAKSKRKSFESKSSTKK